MGRGAGGQNVIDQGEIPAAQVAAAFQGESAAQIFKALLAMKVRLGQRVADPLEAIQDRNLQLFGGHSSEHCGLVELALALARWMQRNRHDGIDAEGADASIGKTLAQHPPQNMTQVELLVVFETMDEFAHDTATAISGGGKIEAEFKVTAIHATEPGLKGTAERLAADRAARPVKSHAGSPAIAAKGKTARNGHLANRTVPRIKKAADRLKQRAGPQAVKHGPSRVS